MNTISRKVMWLIIIVAVSVGGYLVGAQEATPEVTTAVEDIAEERTHTIPDIGTITYPLESYSVLTACGCDSSRAADIFFPGVVTLYPNDHVVHGTAFDTAYRIKIAMVAVEGDLDASMLGTGPLVQYDADIFDPGDVTRLNLNGTPALRIDNLPAGPAGTVTMDIIAVVNDRMIEILVEPVADVGGTATEGLAIVNQIIGSITFDTTQ